MKGTKPFKTKKKRGGRFGLKRLKEKRKEELVIEGTPPRLEMSDVDVEFSLPKFKQRSVKVEAGGAVGKAKRKIRWGWSQSGKHLKLFTIGFEAKLHFSFFFPFFS